MRQRSLNAEFITEPRDISVGLGGKADTFWFFCVRGPNNSQIEINTGPDNKVGHIHMWSADSIAAGDWYRNMFGFVPGSPCYPDLVAQTGRGGISRQFFDSINVIIVKARDGTEIRSTRGSVTDHIGVSAPKLDAAMTAVRTHRIKVLEEPSDGPCKPCRHAFIEGPDKMAIELIEDHSGHPPITD